MKSLQHSEVATNENKSDIEGKETDHFICGCGKTFKLKFSLLKHITKTHNKFTPQGTYFPQKLKKIRKVYQPWNYQENANLKSLVTYFGTCNWKTIALYIPERSSTQI